MRNKPPEAGDRPKPAPPAAEPRRPSGARGHLLQGERSAVIALWNRRAKTRGAISRIAQQLGISHVAVSNIVLLETGKRPSFHDDPQA